MTAGMRLLLRLVGGARRKAVRRAAPARAPRRVRDFQRARVYRWENDHVLPLAATPLSLDACRALVKRVYLEMEADRAHLPGWAPPLVTDGRGRRHAAGSREVIKLPRWSRTTAIVLHECAHGLSRDGHGPEFVSAYVELLGRFAGLDRDALLASLGPAGVRHAGPYRR